MDYLDFQTYSKGKRELQEIIQVVQEVVKIQGKLCCCYLIYQRKNSIGDHLLIPSLTEDDYLRYLLRLTLLVSKQNNNKKIKNNYY